MKQEGCSCTKCVECCKHSCGWFGSIEEVKGAAKITGMSLVEFAKEYLIEEYWIGDNDISVIAPRKDFSRGIGLPGIMQSEIMQSEIERNGKGFVKASWSHNLITNIPCIFLDENNKCKIHESKPQECRESFACRSDKHITRDEIAEYWKKHKDFILNLRREIKDV